MKSITYSSVLEEQRIADCAYRHLAECRLEEKAEEIARHYLAHAQLARALLELIDISKRPNMTPMLRKNLDATILEYVSKFSTNHLHDFGIQLAWYSQEREPEKHFTDFDKTLPDRTKP